MSNELAECQKIFNEFREITSFVVFFGRNMYTTKVQCFSTQVYSITCEYD